MSSIACFCVADGARHKRPHSLETLVLVAETLNVAIGTMLPEFRESSATEKETELSDVLNDCSEYEHFILTHSTRLLKRLLRERKHLKSGS